MAVRLQSTGYTSENKQFIVKIYDETYSGAVIDFDMDGNGFIIDFMSDGEELKYQILATKCTVGIYVNNTDIESFITDLNTAYETQFVMTIKYDGGSSAFWVGFVLPDLITIEDVPLEQKPLFKVVATDGVKRMQKTSYKDVAGPYTGIENIVDHMLKCLSHIGLNTYIETEDTSGADIVLQTGLNWVAASQAAGDPADKQKFDHRAIYQIDKKGIIKYPSVYDVIKLICRTFHCRFYMYQGHFNLMQHNEYVNGTITVGSYKSTGTLVAYVSQTFQHFHYPKFNGKHGGGSYSFFPALSIAQVNYIHFGYINLAIGTEWNNTTQPTIPTAPTTYSVAANTSFIFKGDIRIDVTWSANKPVYACFDFLFNVDTDYLKRESYSSGTGSPIELPEEITTTATDRYQLCIPFDPNQGGAPLSIPWNGFIEFSTIKFPNAGDVSFQITLLGFNDSFGNDVTATTTIGSWKIYNVELNPIPDGEVGEVKNVRTVTAFNATTGNSERVIVNNQIGDSLGFGKIWVDNGTTDIIGADWGVGATVASRTLEELLAIEYIRTQAVPIKKMITTFDRYNDLYADVLNIEDVILHKTDKWVFWKGRYIAGPEIIEGTWYLANTAGTTSGNTTDDGVIEFIDLEGNSVLTVSPVGTGGGVPTTPDTGITDPNTPAVISIFDILFPRTTNDIDEGDTVTQIPVEARTEDGEYKVGQVITLINPTTGAQQNFTVATETQTTDTVIEVNSVAAAFDFPTGSWIVKSQETQAVSGGGSASMYRQEFAAHASATITVTENSGVLPTNAAAIKIYFDTGQIISKTYWSHVAATGVITLTFTPPGQQSIWVEFTI